MVLSEKLMQRVAKVFARNNDRDKVWVTDDNQIFVEENDANGQAENLKRNGKKNGITVVRRSDVQPVKDADKGEATNTPSGPEQKKDDAGDGKNTPGKPELTREEQRAKAAATLDALRKQLEELPETAHANTRKALEKKVAAAEAALTELDAE